MKKYYLCLEENNYNIDLGNNDTEIMYNLETMLDNLKYLLESYGIGEEEILEEIQKETTIKIEKESD